MYLRGACAQDPLQGVWVVSLSRLQHGVSPLWEHPAQHSPRLHRTLCLAWLGDHGACTASCCLHPGSMGAGGNQAAPDPPGTWNGYPASSPVPCQVKS